MNIFEKDSVNPFNLVLDQIAEANPTLVDKGERVLRGYIPFDPYSEEAGGANEKQIEMLKVAGVWDYYTGEGAIREPLAPTIGYGGAVFGGKTYGMLGLASILAYAFPGCQMGFFRRTYKELEGAGGAIHEAHEVFYGIAISRDGGKHWHFPETGSDLYMQHCEYEKDVFKYQSKQFDFLFIDESTHFTWFQIDYLMTRNRATTMGVKPFAVLSSNPGNVGHMWYMNLFDLELQYLGTKGDKEHNQVKHVLNFNNKWTDVYFIPAFLEDNKIGVMRDPEYENRLMERDPDTAQALRWGDWTVFTGQAFREFDRERHVIQPFTIPSNWHVWRAVDWGWDAPFCCLWFTRDPITKRIYVIREIAETGLTDPQQAYRIAELTPHTEKVSFTFADPAMWAKKNVRDIVMSSFDQYLENGIYLTKADNDRVNGKKKVHSVLADLPDGKPGMQIFSTCKQLITVLPKLSKNENNPEDVMDQDGDDPYDTLRYGLSNVQLFAGSRKRRDPKDEYVLNPWQQVKGML